MVVIFRGKRFAAQGIVETVKEGCKQEIELLLQGCQSRRGTRARLLLFAHEDKLSNRCEYALYDAAAQLERAVAALTYLANECKDDLKTFCSGIKPGEGRLLQCIDKNKEKISGRCKQAIRDVGAK
jgi:hypothetical protein